MSKYLAGILFLSLLQNCGGGGTTLSNSPTPPIEDLNSVTPKISTNGLSIYYPNDIWVNGSVSIVVKSNTLPISSVNWTQTLGPSVPILANNSQVIGFDIPTAGTYSFKLTVVTTDNVTNTQDINFTALENPQSLVNIRLDHVAIEQGKVSLRVDASSLAATKTINTINWQQIAGPDVDDLSIEQHYLFFNAPEVTEDTILEFSAEINYTDGSSGSDTSYVLIKNANIDTEGYFPKYAEQIVTQDVFPYVSDSPYADSLVNCVYNNQIKSSCSFATLPLIGTEHPSPTIDEILERLVVSHKWMGDRFKQYLEQSLTSDDMLKLLRATTAIVISYDVRPSFYWSATGAIYLDAANFWMTPEERDSLNDQADYRSSFGDELGFILPWRYVKDNQYYIKNSEYPVIERLSKPFTALEANVSWLMYHELGHANDFFPPTSWASISRSTNPLSYANNNAPSSTQFSEIYPLGSIEMAKLAQVSFKGEQATNSQKAYTADDIVSFFTPDNAPDYYCYSTIREDYATLFGHFMMAYRLGVSADVAIISNQDNEALIVTWGQRNRVNSPAIQSRVKSVVQTIFPQLNVTQIQATLPPTILMQPGEDWFSNLTLNPAIAPTQFAQKTAENRPKLKSDYWQTFPHGPKKPIVSLN